MMGVIGSTAHVNKITPFYDLQISQLTNPNTFTFLSTYLKEKTIIGLGETSHGTQEFYQAKSSIAKYLINQHQFKRIALEMDVQVADQLNNFVLQKHDQIDDVLKEYGLYNAEEFKNLLVWIRHKNATIPAHKDKIQLIGFDQIAFASRPLRRDSLMAQQFLQIASEQKYIVWAHAIHLLKSNTWDTTHSGVKAMGNYLSQHFGNQYYLLVLDTQQGTVNVIEDRKLKSYTFALEKELLVQDVPNFYLHLRTLSTSPVYPLTYIGSAWNGAAQSIPTQLEIDFDGLLFIQNTTASKSIE
jgi:erythromycin esterase-like protein